MQERRNRSSLITRGQSVNSEDNDDLLERPTEYRTKVRDKRVWGCRTKITDRYLI